MSEPLARRAGSALAWRVISLAGSRAIGLVRTLVLARLLVPEDFGLLAVGVVTIEFLLSLTDFGLRQALVQQRNPTDQQFHTAWTVGILRAGLVAAVVVVAAPFIAGLFEETRAVNVIRLLALGPVIDATRSARTTELTRALEFRSLTYISLTAAAVHALVAIALAPSAGVWAMVVGSLAGMLAGSLVSYRVAPYRPRLLVDRDAARPLFTFGRWVFVSGVIAVLADLVLQGVVSRRLGAAELGLYYLAARFAFLPNQVVSDAVSKVAFPVHVRLADEPARAGVAFRKSLSGMWALLIPVYSVLIVLTPWLVREVLGTNWTGAITAIQILALAGIAGVIADNTIPLLKGRGRTRGLVVLYGVRSVVIIALAWALTGRLGVAGAATAWLVAELAAQVACVLMAGRLIPSPLSGTARSATAAAGAGAAGSVAALICVQVLAGPAGVVFSAAFGLTVAGLCLYWLDRRFDLGLARDLIELFPGLSPLLSRSRSVP